MGLKRRAVLAGAATLAAAPFARNARADADPDIGHLQLQDPPAALPAISWVDASGATHHLADYAGQGLILNFWATWCGPCVAEMPSLAALAAQLKADRIVVVPISADSGGAKAVQGFFAAHNVQGMGVFLDPTMAAMNAAKAVGLPTTLIVNRAGREAARIAGAANWTAPGTAQTVRVLVG